MPNPVPAGRSIQVTCHCGARFAVDARHAGRQGSCPRCHGQVTVPPASETVCPQCRTINAPDLVQCVACGATLHALDETVMAPSPARRSSRMGDTEIPASRPPMRPRAPETSRPRPGVSPDEILERFKPPKVDGSRPTDVPKAGSAPPPAPPPPPEPAAAPAAEPAAAALKRSGAALRNKLADMDKPRRPLILRLFVFVVLAGGAGFGAWHFGRQYFEPKIAHWRAEEDKLGITAWPGNSLDKLHDQLKQRTLAMNPNTDLKAPYTPEQNVLTKAIHEEIEALRTQSQEATKAKEKAHEKMQHWQLAFYGAIAGSALVVGLIGLKIVG